VYLRNYGHKDPEVREKIVKPVEVAIKISCSEFTLPSVFHCSSFFFPSLSSSSFSRYSLLFIYLFILYIYLCNAVPKGSHCITST